LILACERVGVPLKLNADLSHWCAAGERVFDDNDPEFAEIIGLVAKHAHLVHARVGWAQGPQVPDPRVEAYSAEVAAHESWWDEIRELKAPSPLLSSPLLSMIEVLFCWLAAVSRPVFSHLHS